MQNLKNAFNKLIEAMKTTPSMVLVLVLISTLTVSQSRACTTFCIIDSQHHVLGRNFDFYTGAGHVVVNKRNVIKSAMNLPPEKPFTWTSKYGSITFNQFGREFPHGGINEKGLVVELLWLNETAYSEIDGRDGLPEQQWIQFQLDNSATVDDILQSDSFIRISKLSVAPIHFFVSDPSGKIATIEYINGKMIYHTDVTLPVPVLANDTYSKSTSHLKDLINSKTEDPSSFTSGSLNRFSKTASLIKQFEGKNVINYSFKTLKEVSQENFTQWSVVYDLKNLTVYFKTLKNKTIKKIDLSEFSFSCESPMLFADVNSDMVNEKVVFQDHSFKSNLALINIVAETINNQNSMPPIPKEEIEFLARFPETTKCNE